MSCSDEIASLLPANEAEARALESSWDAGALRPHVERLLAFVDRNRGAIMALASEQREQREPDEQVATGDLTLACKRLIARLGVVHLPSEMKDQVRAIQDEIWIRGERGDYDRVFIAHEWTSRHAAAWRLWRLKEYVFVADRCASEILARLEPR